MLRALLVPYPPRRFSELDIKGLIDDAIQRTLIPRDHEADFEALNRDSRLGVRVRDSKMPEYEQFVPQCARRLAKISGWFYNLSTAKRSMPPDIAEALSVLEGETSVRSRELMAQERQAELIARLSGLIDDREAHLHELEKLGSAIGSHVEKERAAVDADKEQLAEIEDKLSAIKGFPSFSVPKATSTETKQSSWSSSWVIAGSVGIVLGMVVAYVLLGGQVSADNDEPSLREEEGEDLIVDGGPDAGGEKQVKSGATAISGEQGDSETPAVLDGGAKTGGAPCPEGMVEYESAVVRIIQPFPRRSWPPGPKALPTVKVGHFCLDRDPVLVSDYEKCAAAGECQPRIHCLDHPRNFPVNCVTWENANDYCSWRGGKLPSVAQWERTLLPGSKIRTETSRGTWEWVADHFPSPLFQRGPAKTNEDGSVWGYMALQKQFVPASGGRRMCSWHKAPATASRGTLSFRCALNLE